MINLMKRPGVFLLLVVACALLCPTPSAATTDYARQTGLTCGECHVEAIGGGPLTRKGEEFIEELKVKGLYRPLTAMQKNVRFIIAFVHLLTAIAWFGTILYVHILLKPAYASKGLPRGELLLGWSSIVIMAVTGTLLSIARIPTWQTLVTTRFGILLSIKILLFLIMASSALIVTAFIGPRLRRQRGELRKMAQDLASVDFSSSDGREGRPAHIAYKGGIYDVTESRLWRDGVHMKRHQAGTDLTDALKSAPHGEDKVLSMKRIGEVKKEAAKAARPFHERMFYFFAYMNLGFVFLIVLVIALMRWG